MNGKKFHQNHPYLFVLLLQITIILVAIIAGGITKRMGLPIYVLYGSMMTALTIITALILWKMKWWTTIGFRKFPPKSAYLLIIPALPLVGNLFGSYNAIDLNLYFIYLLLNVMVGFVEEGMYRGLMLRTLLHKGIWFAAIVPSIIFSLSHSMNMLAGWPWPHVALQIVYSFAIGFGWAAFAIRTETIWPLMLLHFLGNFVSFIKTDDFLKNLQSNQPSLTGLIYTMVLTVIFILYGIVILRTYTKKAIDDAPSYSKDNQRAWVLNNFIIDN